MAENYYPIVASWESVSEADRAPFKAFIQKLVGYECKMACIANDGWVDIYVLNLKTGKVSDWLEIQPTGAIGVTFDSYSEVDSISVAVSKLSDRCEDFNDELGVEFEEEGASDDEDDEDGSGSSSE